MSDFKVGDVVTCVDISNNVWRPSQLQLGKQYTVTDVIPKGSHAGGEVYLDNDNRLSWKPSRFTKQVQAFTKAMLKPGMRVVLRDSTVLVACVSNLQETGGSAVAALCYYHDNGIRTNSSTKHCDIMEVWSGPELAVDFFDMSKMGALLFKRVEKTEEELKKEAQLKDIAELEARLAELKAKINT